VAKSISALVTPSVLRWARELAGMDVPAAADKISTLEERIIAWEAGDAKPTLRQARLLATAYRLPLATFYLPEPPATTIRLPKDYRRLAGTLMDGISSAIRLSVRDAWEKREIALDLISTQGLKPDQFSIRANLQDDPEDVGEKIRRMLGVTLSEQSEWRDTRKAFNAWRRYVEAAGALVLQTSEIPLDEMRAYSLYAPLLPVIVLNRKDAPAGRSFSLLHECAHLALRTEGICDQMTEVDRSAEEQQLEVFCNAVSAASLVPKTPILEHPIVRRHRHGLDWSDSEIQQLSRAFSISREAILRRLLTFNLTTRAFYEHKRAEQEEEYRNRPAEKGGFVPPPVNVLSSLGRPYVKLVLDSLAAGELTMSDAADYLGLKLKHLPALIGTLEGEGE
jgi:Zn-dependent peptidase ImmA (M78 family)